MSQPKPVITFDLDGVLCRPPFGINPGSRINKSREKPGTRGILWRTETWRYLGRRPMPGAVEAFRELRRTFDCQVLTARAEAARPLTERWFQQHFGFVPHLNMRPDWHETPARFKTRRILELGASAHFEDDPFTALWVAELVPHVFLVDWRRNRAVSDPRLNRISTIAEAAPLLARLLPA